jgi:hypothetical protein
VGLGFLGTGVGLAPTLEFDPVPDPDPEPETTGGFPDTAPVSVTLAPPLWRPHETRLEVMRTTTPMAAIISKVILFFMAIVISRERPETKSQSSFPVNSRV